MARRSIEGFVKALKVQIGEHETKLAEMEAAQRKHVDRGRPSKTATEVRR